MGLRNSAKAACKLSMSDDGMKGTRTHRDKPNETKPRHLGNSQIQYFNFANRYAKRKNVYTFTLRTLIL
jgi:hypothetical protein